MEGVGQEEATECRRSLAYSFTALTKYLTRRDLRGEKFALTCGLARDSPLKSLSRAHDVSCYNMPAAGKQSGLQIPLLYPNRDLLPSS